MKNSHTAISILAGLVLSENLFAQSATGPTADLEAQKLNGLQKIENTSTKPYMPSTLGPGTTDPDSGLAPRQPVFGPVPLKSNGSGQAIRTEPASNSTLPVLIPNTGKIESDNQVDTGVSLRREKISNSVILTGQGSTLNRPIHTKDNSQELDDNTISVTKTALDVPGLIKAIKETTDVSKYLKDVKNNVSVISSSVSTQQKNVKTLLSNLNELTKKIGQLNGSATTESTYKALDAVSKKINSYENESAKIFLKVTEIDSKVSDLNKDLKVAEDAASNVEFLQDGSKFSKALKIADYAGKAITLASMVNEATKLDERIASGSSMKAELLTIALIGVESFQPSVPGFKNPSDVARAMIDLTNDLKERNASLVNFNKSLDNNVYQLLNGGSSFNAFLEKNLREESFSAGSFNEELLNSYESLKSKYLESYDNIISQAEKQKNMVQELYDKAWLDSSKSMYKSLLAGLDVQIANLNKY